MILSVESDHNFMALRREMFFTLFTRTYPQELLQNCRAGWLQVVLQWR